MHMNIHSHQLLFTVDSTYVDSTQGLFSPWFRLFTFSGCVLVYCGTLRVTAGKTEGMPKYNSGSAHTSQPPLLLFPTTFTVTVTVTFPSTVPFIFTISEYPIPLSLSAFSEVY